MFYDIDDEYDVEKLKLGIIEELSSTARNKFFEHVDI
jgi:hypothetical protein